MKSRKSQNNVSFFSCNEGWSKDLLSHELLKDDYTIEQADFLQDKYRTIVEEDSQETIDISDITRIKRIAGVDAAYYTKNNKEFGVACAVLWDLHKSEMICNNFAQGIVNFPYKPGYLGFRECRLLASAIIQFPQKPDVIMCDGHGITHPKSFGLSVHLGRAINIPSLGVAKNPYVGHYEWNSKRRTKGKKAPIYKEGSVIDSKLPHILLGYAICLNDNFKPVFVSVGHKISLELAVKLAMDTSINHRQPEPLYLADKFSREKVKEFAKKNL